jgi:hypothetical protein
MSEAAYLLFRISASIDKIPGARKSKPSAQLLFLKASSNAIPKKIINIAKFENLIFFIISIIIVKLLKMNL